MNAQALSDASGDDWMARANEALAVLQRNPALAAAVKADVDAFFAAHPTEDDPLNRTLMATIVFRRLLPSVEGEHGTHESNQTQKQ